MNSFNHYAYGAVGNWMYTTIAGLQIDPDNPGYSQFVVNPTFTGRLSYAKASHVSMYGKIVSGWKAEGDSLVLEVEVPGNTIARVYVPAKANSVITENGKPVSDIKEIKPVGIKDGRMIFEVGSGKYRFESEK